MNKLIALVIGISISSLFFLINFLFFSKTFLFNTLNILAALISILPFLIFYFLERRKIKKIEENFVAFLRDLVEAVRGGMTLPIAFHHISSNYYGVLTPYVKKMVAQLDWGIPLTTVLIKFAKDTKSQLIQRTISSVIESHAYGGNLVDVLDALAGTVVEVDRLRAERRVYVHSQIITGYLIFFVFLGVMMGLQVFLIPSLVGKTESLGMMTGLTGALPAMSPTEMVSVYRELFKHLVIIQGIFAGFMIGKMAEGEIIAGLKHSLFLSFTGFLVLSLFG